MIFRPFQDGFVKIFNFAIFCRFVGKNVAKFLCYIDLLKVTKLTRLAQTEGDPSTHLSFEAKKANSGRGRFPHVLEKTYV